VGPTAADARNVMVEGASGILAISPDRGRPLYEPSKRRLTWPNGAVATTYSADEPERLRGPLHDAAWCDELAAWRYPEAWDMLMFGMRLGADPRTVVTTTLRPAKLIRDLVRDPICVLTRGSSTKIAATWRRHFLIRSFANTRAPGSAGRSSKPSCSKTRPARCGRSVRSRRAGCAQRLASGRFNSVRQFAGSGLD
jgi:phage terminase large subunit-like protein